MAKSKTPATDALAKMKAVSAPEILPKEHLVKHLDEMLSDLEYDIKRAKAPKKKRGLERSKEFFSSITWYLKNEGKEVAHG